MKRIISVLLILCMAFSVVACKKAEDAGENVKAEETVNPGESVDPKVTNEYDNAVWEGHDNIPFKTYLEKGVAGVYEDSAIEATIKVSCKEGWGDSTELTTADVPAGSKAVTYEVDIVNDSGNSLVFHFFMAAGDKLTLIGGRTNYDGDASESTFDNAEGLLLDLKPYVE